MHIKDSIVYVPPCTHESFKESRQTLDAKKPPDTREKMLKVLAASTQSTFIPSKNALIDGQSKAAELSKVWRGMADLLHIDDDDYRKRILVMLKRHEHMWSGHIREIKGTSHRIDMEPVTCPILQHPYCYGKQRGQLIEDHVKRMFTVEVIEPAQRNWVSLIGIAPKNDGTHRLCFGCRKLNDCHHRGLIPASMYGRLHI